MVLFLVGVLVGAVGILTATWVDVGMTWLESFWRDK